MTNKNSFILAAVLLLVFTVGSVRAQAITVSGQATADCLGAVPGVEVYLAGVPEYPQPHVVTDSDGNYSFTDVPFSDTQQVWIAFTAPPGLRYSSPRTVYFMPSSDQTIDLSLTCIVATIRGQVTSDCEGNLGDVQVHLDRGDGSEVLTATTGADGKYQFSNISSMSMMRLWIVPPEDDTVALPVTGEYSFTVTGLFIPPKNFQLLCPLRVIYFEDFDQEDHGWTTEDFTYLPGIGPWRWSEVSQSILDNHWYLDTYNDRGVYWCGAEATEPCLGLITRGYGNQWNEELVSTVTLADPTTLTIVHQYDTEPDFDFCYVEISDDAGATFETLRTFTGKSYGFVTSSITISGYEGEVQLRFRFNSDAAWSDEGGGDTDGAWRIDRIDLNGATIADFESGSDGWLAPAELPNGDPLAAFRLQASPPCNPGAPDFSTCYPNMGRSWVAYDAVTQQVPLNPQWLIDRGSSIRLAITSPEIPLPAGHGFVFFDLCTFARNMTLANLRFYAFEVLSATPSTGCEKSHNNNTFYYGNDGWFGGSLTFPRIDIRNLLEPGATSFRLRLIYFDWSGYCRNGYSPALSPCTGEVESSEAPYFDNVVVAARGHFDPSVGAYVPSDLECPAGYATPGGPTTVTVSGTVVLGGGLGPLAGVSVDLVLGGGEVLSTLTDAQGAYLFEDVPQSADPGEISIVVPLGFVAVTPPEAHTAVDLSQNQIVDFVLDRASPSGPVRTIGYWKHEARAYLEGKGHPHETQEDMETNFPQILFERFYGRAEHAIVVENVTYSDDGSGPRPITLATIQNTLTVNQGGTMLDRAKQQYLGMLLNVASGKLQTYSVISVDGSTTASQALQEIADLILDGNASNDEVAKDIADIINNGNLVPLGMIRDIWGTTLYSVDPPGVIDLRALEFKLDDPRPNPCAPSTSIRFELAQPGEASLRVYDSAGRLVRDLAHGSRAAGEHLIAWDGVNNAGERVASGVYFLRLETQGYRETRRLVLTD